MLSTMRRPSLQAAALALTCACTCASAETQVSLYTGTSLTRDSDLRVGQPGVGTDLTLHGVRWDARPFHPAPYYGLRVTRFLDAGSPWGVALDYTHYKMYARTDRVVQADGTFRGTAVSGPAPMSRYVQQFELSHGVNLLSVSAIYRWQELALLGGRVQPYLGAGLAHYRPHSENQVGGLPHETGYAPSGLGWQALAGARYGLTDRTSLFLETKFNSGTARVDIAGGRAETPLRTFHLLGGITVGF